MSSLIFRAGSAAYEEIRTHGFAADRIGTIAGASGGAKWLILSQIDRVIVRKILPQLVGPVHLIGSSIGAWRLACYAQDAPLEAIERFESAYLEQRYSDNPDITEISDKSREILEHMLGPDGPSQVVRHPLLRMHVMTVRSRFLTASERRMILAGGLMLAATLNIVSRRSLAAFFRRSLFYNPRDLPPCYDAPGFPMDRIALTERNLADSILASGAIPLVLNGIRDIEGAPSGVYRDGGIIDYHLDLPLSGDGRLTLYPHFFELLIPGWFDKKLAWRKHAPEHTERTILICPSPEFIARLPNGKVPDRTDFRTMPAERRIKIWTSVIDACKELADELNDVIDKDQLAARLEPL